jgi:methionyl-tRNA synthetase
MSILNISITTAIDYANGNPHLGHLFEKALSSFLMYYYSHFSYNINFSIGLDEHGLKVQNYALNLGEIPLNFVNRVSNKFQIFFKKFYINYSQFVRTSSRSHFKTCTYILKYLKHCKYVYVSYYSGYYSSKEETFLTEKSLRQGYF